MKLFIATTHLEPDAHFGGVVRSGQAMAENLKALLPDVGVACVSRDPGRVRSFNALRPLCVQSYWCHRWGFAPGWGRTIAPVVSAAEVVWVNGVKTYPMTVAARLCRRYKVPYIVTPRGDLLPGNLMIRPIRKRVYHALFDRQNLAGAAAIHATSEDERAVLTARGFERVFVLPNGVDLAPLLPPEMSAEELPAPLKEAGPDTPLALFLGRIHPIKGLDNLLAAWARMLGEAQAAKNAKLAIAGPEGERGYLERLKALARELRIADRLLFCGMVEGRAKQALLQRATLLVLPSITESFGNVVVEALACGTPAVATTGTPWRDLETYRAGRWTSPDVPSLAGALRDILEMPPKERLEMGLRGKQLVAEKYTWQAIARQFAEVVLSVAAGSWAAGKGGPCPPGLEAAEKGRQGAR